jgi:hypothetical protein
LGFGVRGLMFGCRGWRFEVEVQGLGFRVPGSGCGVWGSEFGSGFRVRAPIEAVSTPGRAASGPRGEYLKRIEGI